MVAWLCRQTLSAWIFPMMLDVEIGVSQFMVDQLEAHAGARLRRTPKYLCHLAVDTARFQAANELIDIAGLAVPHGYAIVGSVGRLSPEKGYVYLLNAVPSVLARLPDTLFVLVGDGPQRGELEETVHRLGIHDHVILLGQRRDIASLLKRMDLFVLPSLGEGLPTVVLESMASGVPVIATDVPGTRELVRHGDTGWLVPVASPAALAQTMVDALGDPALRKEMSDRAAKWVNRFSIHRIAGRCSAVYRTLLTWG